MEILSLNLTAALACEGWMEPDELEWLAAQAHGCQVMIEVGCWKGRSTLALADNTRGRVYAVDHWQGTPGDDHVEEVRRLGGPHGLFHAFRRNLRGRDHVVIRSMDASQAARAFAPYSADLVFIDASHQYADVKHDIENYRPLVKSGGILCGHDYGNPLQPGVSMAVDEAFPNVQRAGFSLWWVRL